MEEAEGKSTEIRARKTKTSRTGRDEEGPKSYLHYTGYGDTTSEACHTPA